MSRRLFEDLRKKAPCWSKFMADPQLFAQFKEEMCASLPHWGEPEREMMLHEMAFASRWLASGQIVYSLSHGLAAMFAITSSPPIDWKRTPHEAFVIKVPRMFLPLKGTIEPEYSYIYAWQHGTLLVADWDTTAVLHLSFPDVSEAGELESINALDLQRRFMANAKEALSPDRLQKELLEVAKHIQETQRVPSQVAAEIAERSLEDFKEKHEKSISGISSIGAKGLGRRVLCNRFLANTIAYVTNHHVSVPHGNLGRDVEAPPPFVPLTLPPEVTVDRAFRDAARDAVASIVEGSVVGIRRMLAHYVRGHWRNQPIGEGRAERKLIWIAPHRRGDEAFGSVVRRIARLDIPVRTN